MDAETQLDTLVGRYNWFGLGSRIIVTNRDNHLLKGLVDYINEAKLINNDETLTLFSLLAFKEPYPHTNYVNLSKGFISYARGLPLVLIVLGSFLFGRTTYV